MLLDPNYRRYGAHLSVDIANAQAACLAHGANSYHPLSKIKHSVLRFASPIAAGLSRHLSAVKGNIERTGRPESHFNRQRQGHSCGKWLSEVFKDYHVVFVIGAHIFSPRNRKFTPFQGIHRLLSLLPRTVLADQNSHRCRPNPGIRPRRAPGTTGNRRGTLNRSFESPRKKAKIGVILPDEMEHDELFIVTLAAGKDNGKKPRTLYGPVLNVITALKVS
ncbi:hypothetical protein B0H19DRAFT_1079261 [Mycena capillaripes]|nr:hypothetical protein B0H19DRAFT_1079261 [Mycena capillaripes]